jgi:hypothetical protein
MANNYKWSHGEKCSKMSPKKRETELKKYQAEVSAIVKQQKSYDAAKKRFIAKQGERRPHIPWELESKLSDLKHTYKRNDWVVVKSNYHDNRYVMVQVSKLVGAKMYEVHQKAGMKGGFTVETYHESKILGGVSSIASIGDVEMYSAAYKGKVPFKKSKKK